MDPMIFDSGSLAWLSRRDGSVVVGYGPFTMASAPPEHGVAFFVSDFASGHAMPWRVPNRFEVMLATDFAQLGRHHPAPQINWQPPDASDFALVFQEILAAIQSGEFEKTVPVVTECGTTSTMPGPWISTLMARQVMPLHSYGWLDGASGFAGATPELLFALDGRNLETMALAGTARSEDSDAFSVDEKEIREHEFVAETLIRKFSVLGDVTRLPRETLNLGPIVHFHSSIRVHLNSDTTPDALIELLHPTPALGPLPRNARTLSQLEHWRHMLKSPPGFGAPFGVLHEGRFEAVVCIRAIWWHGCELRLPAGCGVIEASRLVNEWRELRLKREAVKRFLELTT